MQINELDDQWRKFLHRNGAPKKRPKVIVINGGKSSFDCGNLCVKTQYLNIIDDKTVLTNPPPDNRIEPSSTLDFNELKLRPHSCTLLPGGPPRIEIDLEPRMVNLEEQGGSESTISSMSKRPIS
uniref:Uncharacterized protein n=1 Tax=Romanomermis culicivorax TaxID=13658 RepID=A0A915JGM0_ROMCU